MDAMGNFGRLRATALAVALALGPGAALAQQPGDGPMIQARKQLLNAEVKNSLGEELGEIEELVLDGQGRIQYVVISHGGFLNIGDELVVIPWERAGIKLSQDDHVLVDLSRTELAKAPSFKKDRWPDMNAQAWSDEMRTYSGSFAASVDAPARTGVDAFEALDQNQDGRVSPQEAQARQSLSARFEELDRNGDGQLSRWEFNIYSEPALAEGEPSSPSERARAALTEQEEQRREEIERSNDRLGLKQHAGKDDDKQKSPMTGGNAERDAEQAMERAQKASGPSFAELDRDDDGKLSRKEAQAASGLEQQFATVDVNNDGAIDAAEFSAFEKEIGGQGAADSSAPTDKPDAAADPRRAQEPASQ